MLANKPGTKQFSVYSKCCIIQETPLNLIFYEQTYKQALFSQNQTKCLISLPGQLELTHQEAMDKRIIVV